MPLRPGIEKHYVGKSGQLKAMSEFLWRGWNVAMPEVDEGDDIFVVQHANGDLIRVQVKTATAHERGGAMEGQFSIAKHQITVPRIPELHFVFCFRRASGDWRFAAVKADPFPFALDWREDLDRRLQRRGGGRDEVLC